jgi:epoxyqueuosine reductase QueG
VKTPARRVEDERQKEEDVQLLTPALLDQMSFSELEVLQRLVGDAIDRRRRDSDRYRRRVGKRKPTVV